MAGPKLAGLLDTQRLGRALGRGDYQVMLYEQEIFAANSPGGPICSTLGRAVAPASHLGVEPAVARIVTGGVTEGAHEARELQCYPLEPLAL